MSTVAARLLRIPAVVLVVWAAFAALVPVAMAGYASYAARGLTGCRLVRTPNGVFETFCPSVAEAHRGTFAAVMTDAALRSLALLAGAAVLALVVGGLLGIAAALLRRRAVASGAIVGVTSLLAAVPSFFVAYFLQIAVIVLGNAAGRTLLPVFGFGYDAHLVLPLLSISLPAVAYTAQLTAARMNDVLDADFITTANAKGLLTSRIIAVHVLPHVRPVLFEALGSGLRVSVASLPIIEFLFNWNGIGSLSVQAVALKDAQAFVFCAVVLVAVFAVLSAVADLSRPRALFAR